MVIIKRVVAFLMLALSSSVMAQSVAINPDHPDRYTVIKGDTLWDISGKFLRDPWRWPQVWKNNPEIENPHLIYPGDTIYLTYRDGQPVFNIDRSADRESGVVRLSPQIHAEPMASVPVPTIPMELIRPFLSDSRVVSERELSYAGYILANQGGNLISGVDDIIYARELTYADTKEYMILRPGKAYFHPDDPEREIGYQAIYVGKAQLLDADDPSTLRVMESDREILSGDRLLPTLPEAALGEIMPRAPDELLEGYILGLLDGVAKIGQYQVVILSLGENDGAQVGHILNVWQTGRMVVDRYGEKKAEKVMLPESVAGNAMIFQVFESASYALIMDAYREMSVHDKVKTP